jgi:hypothetical protein
VRQHFISYPISLILSGFLFLSPSFSGNIPNCLKPGSVPAAPLHICVLNSKTGQLILEASKRKKPLVKVAFY